MAKFDFMFLGLIILGTIIASYVLNYAGYLTHSSPLRAKTGRTSMPVRTSMPTARTYGAMTMPSASVTRVSRTSVGPNEPVSGMMSRPVGGRPFST